MVEKNRSIADEFLKPIVLSHVQRYPAMQPADLYKLIFQGTLGSEHAKGDRNQVLANLNREIQSMGDGPAEPLVDPIGLEPKIVRVHLRPFVAQGGGLSELVDAFLASMDEKTAGKAELASRIEAARQLAQAGALPFDLAAWDAFCQIQAVKHYPAVHHSSAYRGTYRPAYRVIVGSSSGLWSDYR